MVGVDIGAIAEQTPSADAGITAGLNSPVVVFVGLYGGGYIAIEATELELTTKQFDLEYTPHCRASDEYRSGDFVRNLYGV